MSGIRDAVRSPETVLVLAPTGRDGPITAELLGEAGLEAHVCADANDLATRMQAGAGCALVSEEALTPAARARLATALAGQPAWSDFPFVVIATRGDGREEPTVTALGLVTFLDRPVQVRTMIAAVQSALRSRRHQYQARRAIEARDEFLAMLGHELRNPLGAMRLALDLAACREGPLGERERGVIDRQSRHLARLVDDLLDVARVTTGKISLRYEEVDLAELVRACVTAMEPAASAQGLLLTAGTSSPLAVRGDRLRLEQIFMNMIGNAVKYTPRGGAISVDARAVGASARVSIVDDGLGIGPDVLPHVFDLFTQADRSLDRAQGGLGVGLTVARTLARLHSGEIVAESAGVGRGSAFHVTLPLQDREELRGRESATAPEARPLRLVIVEDNPDLRDMLEQTLLLAGHAVTPAIDGYQGIEAIVRERPDAALIDLGLPGIDGLEVARRVRAAGLGEVLLVAVTGYGQADDRTRAANAGFDAHLTKPVDASQIAQILAGAPSRSLPTARAGP